MIRWLSNLFGGGKTKPAEPESVAPAGDKGTAPRQASERAKRFFDEEAISDALCKLDDRLQQRKTPSRREADGEIVADALDALAELGVAPFESMAWLDVRSIFVFGGLRLRDGSPAAQRIVAHAAPGFTAALERHDYEFAAEVAEYIGDGCPGAGQALAVQLESACRSYDGAEGFDGLAALFIWARARGSARDAALGLSSARPTEGEQGHEAGSIAFKAAALCVSLMDFDAFSIIESQCVGLYGQGFGEGNHLGEAVRQEVLGALKQGEPQRALTLSQAAIDAGLDDGTKGGFEARAKKASKMIDAAQRRA